MGAATAAATRAVAPTADALDRAQLALASQGKLVALKGGHIANLDGMLADRDARVARLQQKLAKRSAQVEKLKSRPVAVEEAGEPTDVAPRPGGRWFRRRP